MNAVNRRFLLPLSLLALVAVSCATESGPSMADAAAVKASVDSLWTHYARASDRHDGEAFGALFAEDATLVLSNAPTVRGRDAIKSYLASLYAPRDATGLRISQEDLSVAGAVAVQSGTFEEDFTEDGRAKTEYGRYSLIVERGEDKGWRMRRLVAIADSTRG